MRYQGIICLLVLLGLGLWSAATPPIAYAQSGSGKGAELLAQATKSYQSGEYPQALAAVEESFKAGLDNVLSARAILLRAQINEKSGDLAHAFSDYSSARWMQGLPVADHRTADEGRARVMAAMGLGGSSGGGGDGSASRVASAPMPVPGEKSSGGVLGFFGGIFGVSDSRANPQNAAPAGAQGGAGAGQIAQGQAAPQPEMSATPAVRVAAIRPVAASKKAAATQLSKVAPAPHVIKAAATTGGGFHIDFGAARSEGSARSQAQAIKAKLAAILVNRELLIEPGTGSYRILAGPYHSKMAASALCSEIKQHGVACQVTP